MSLDLLLVCLFVSYHLGLTVGLSALMLLFKRFVRWQPKPLLAHNLWLAIFLVSVVTPLLLTGWHASSLYSAGFESLPAESRNAVALTQESPPASTTLQEFAGFISNTESPYYFVDQLVYVFWPILNFLGIAMIVGIAIGIIRILRLTIMTLWLVRCSEKVTLPKTIGVNFEIPVAQSAKISSPMAVGFFSPLILMPAGLLEKLAPEQLLAVLSHEQAHHQRGDLQVSLGLRLCTTIYWWSLPLHYIHAQIKRYRETVCDHQAASKVGNKLTYAQALLDCARLLVPRRNAYIGVELTGRKNELAHRIRSLLNEFRPQKHVTAGVLIAASFYGLVFFQAATALDSQLQHSELLRLTRQYQLQTAEAGAQLLAAIEDDDIAKVISLAETGLNINLPIAVEGTPLMAAVRKGDKDMVEKLLALGADPNQAAERRGNPLIYAAIAGNQQIAEILLKAGAAIDAVVPRDETPLIKAARYGQMEMVKYLVENGAQVNLGVRTSMGDSWEYRTALSRASSQDIKDYLLSAGAI